jgi:hypothetical protein
VVVTVPPVIVRLLQGPAEPDRFEQAFPLLTASLDGFCHVALLSRTELDADADEVRAAIRSGRTRADLERHGRACLIAVEGTRAHYLHLELRRVIGGDTVGAAFGVRQHEVDSVGVELRPLSFRGEPRLAEVEHWQESAALLAWLAARPAPDRDEGEGPACP